MNIRILTTINREHKWDDVEVSFDTTVLQVVHGAETTTFPTRQRHQLHHLRKRAAS